ncbi:hypothetical protein I4902_08595 [Proteus alimentorum]|uniref:Lipoprotein n=1 Tax=Proteus alimentorum TaxID=1973495 RepID=A0ABS0ITK4_9GAMM|nr:MULTISPECIES: hypothetical protein [Enterobacterales]ATN01082.1 hypothetical protein CRN77_15660 [Proteus vulgaris]MBG2875482.1 hypothetical protein [Proteus alimentorum]MBG2879323.1 hypothetical protein [Proteus alimentorum]NBM84771.1 hypothetical protein [Proteus sp. G2661]OXK82156.1 hypothetical protein CD821_24055 [Escherichia coli]
MKFIVLITALLLSGCTSGYKKVDCQGVYQIKTFHYQQPVLVKFDKKRETINGPLYHAVPQLGFKFLGGWVSPDAVEDFSCRGE